MSVGASAAAAAVAVAGCGLGGSFRSGIALAAGFLIGSTTGFAATRALDSPVSFRFSSLVRLGFMTGAAIAAGYAVGLEYAWLVLFGVAGAQLILVVVAARSLLR